MTLTPEQIADGKRWFLFRTDRNGPETSQQHCGLLPQFYRTVSA